MKIAICDDEKVLCEQLKNFIRRREMDYPVEAIDSYGAGEELLAAAGQYDIIFLDIQMAGLNGIDTAKLLRKRKNEAVLIFVTGVKDYVFDAFDVSAFHYLLKPVEKEKLLSVMERAFAEVEKAGAKPKYMLVKVPGGHRRINAADILYAESDGRKVILHMKQENLEFYEKMEELEQRLGEGFYRCHRGYLVSLSEVRGYDKANIRMSNGETVYLAKRKYSEFVQTYCRYLQE